LIEAGVETTYLEARGTIHGFICLRKALPSAQTDITNGLSALKTVLASLSQ
jgi:acetyl esterase